MSPMEVSIVFYFQKKMQTKSESNISMFGFSRKFKIKITNIITYQKT